jgi:FR47-like protein
MVACTLVVYLARAGHLSSVAVRPVYRRRGFARAMVRRAQEAIRASGRSFAALEVLKENLPAQALYAELGYRRLSGSTLFARDPAAGEKFPIHPATRIRAFDRSDARPLAEVANQQLPPEVRDVFPMSPGGFTVPPIIATSTDSESEAWILEGSSGGAVGFLRATVGGLTRAAHLTSPVLGGHVTAEEALDLVRTGLTWIGRQRSVRTVVQVNEGMTLQRQTLATIGFVPQVGLDTLVRPLAA